MNAYLKNNGTALAAAGAALVIIAMGVTSASAGEGVLESIETAPALTCANGSAVDDLKVFNATEHVGGSAVEIVNSFIAKNAGWTHDNANPAYTQRNVVNLGKAAVTQVDVRDSALRRIASFVVAENGKDGLYLSRAFQCETPRIAAAPGSAVNSKNT